MELSQAPGVHSLLTPGGSFRGGFGLEASLLGSVVGGSFPEGGEGVGGEAGLLQAFSPGTHSPLPRHSPPASAAAPLF